MISFKRVSAILAVCMVVVLTIPSVPCYAFDTDNLFARTKASVSGYWDDSTQDHIQQCVTSLDRSNVNSIAAKVANLTTFGGAGNTFDKQYYVVFYWSDSAYIMIYSFDDSGHPFIFCPNNIDSNSYGVSRYRICKSQASSMNAYAIGLSDNSFSEFAGAVSSENGVYVRDWSNGALLCTNLPVYVYNDTQTTNLGTIQSLQETYTNYFPQDLPYLNEDGDIVTPPSGAPDVDEHFGFRKFDSQVVVQSTYAKDASYQALLTWETDPVGGDFVTGNAEDWKLHLDCTIDFTVGQYPDGNVIVPEKQMPGSIVFGGDLVNEDLDWYKAGDYLIDPTDAADHMNNGYCQMSGSGFFVPLLAGMKGDYVRGNKNVERYGLLGDALEAVGAASSTLLGSQLITAFNELTGSSIPNWLEEYTNSNYYYAIDAYSINIKGYLVGPSVQSQYGVANSDFVTFTSSGYAQPVTPEATESVPDPQPQQPYQQTNLPAVTPTGYDSQGNMTYVVVNIDNTDNVPSIDGNNNMSYNPTFSPSVNNSTNVDLGIDNVADTLDPLVVQENQSFWNLFNPFKDNAFIEATEDYMGIIPSQLQTIFISSFGILIGLTVYRFIRRG